MWLGLIVVFRAATTSMLRTSTYFTRLQDFVSMLKAYQVFD